MFVVPARSGLQFRRPGHRQRDDEPSRDFADHGARAGYPELDGIDIHHYDCAGSYHDGPTCQPLRVRARRNLDVDRRLEGG